MPSRRTLATAALSLGAAAAAAAVTWGMTGASAPAAGPRLPGATPSAVVSTASPAQSPSASATPSGLITPSHVTTPSGGESPSRRLPSATARPATIPPAPDDETYPRQLAIPAAGVAMDIEPVGVDEQGRMAVPKDSNVAGWYRFGVTPGSDSGVSAMTAHVDDVWGRLGPLARIAELAPGSEIVVGVAGAPVRYRVDRAGYIEQGALDPDELFAADGPHRLVLITCGGPFLPDEGEYRDYAIVVAEPIAASR